MTALALCLPGLGVLKGAATTDIDVLAGLDEHVTGGHDIYHRRISRIRVGEPDSDGDVVRRLAVDDGEKPVHTQH